MVAATHMSHPVIEWSVDRDEALRKARAERKPVLMYIYQDDCGGCVKLDSVTFHDPKVIDAIRSRFVPLKLHLFKDREFTREHQVWWTPTLLVGDHSGKVRYSSINYLPPAETLDVLDIGEGLAVMRWREYEKSISLFRAVEQRRSSGPMTAEAMYWRGMAEYFRDGKNPASSRAVWDQIKDRFPESIWALRQP